MQEPPSRDELLVELARERSIRRTVRVLKAKRSRIKDDLNQLITHLSLLVPRSKEHGSLRQSNSEIILEALSRLEDDAFTQFLTQIISQDNNNI